MATGYSQDGSSVLPETRERMESDPYQTAPFIDILVEDPRELAQDLGGSRWSWQLGALEETSNPKPPFGFVASSSAQPGTAQAKAPAAPSGWPSLASKESAPEGGLDLFSFTVGTAASSMLLIVVLYLLKGFRSPAFNCTEPHNARNADNFVTKTKPIRATTV